MTRPGDPTRSSGDERDRALERLERALKEALQRSEAAERIIEDQRARLRSLGVGREESMRALAEAREELRLVSRERDELREQLSRVDGMQTATIAIPEDDPGPVPAPVAVPSLDELMSALGDIGEPRGPRVAGHLHQHVAKAADSDGSVEMISPALVFPETFAADGESAQPRARVPRMLVLLDQQQPVKYPLLKETMTIGRADIADIQINNGFLSRVHARVVSSPNGVAIEDVDSKNGIRVNTRLVTRHTLKHGDLVDLGRVRFRYIDTAAEDAG